MPNSLVSVVIPTRDAADRLVDTVESVLAQTYRKFEVVIVDDGSKDNTAEVLQPYWQFVRYYYKDPRGLSTALNTGVREANAEWIAFLMPGSRWMPGKLEWQRRTVELYGPQYGVCLSAVRHADENSGKKIDQDLTTEPATVAFGKIDRPAEFVAHSQHALDLSSIMVDRSQFERVEGFDENMITFQDRDLLFRLGLLTRFCFVNKPLSWSSKTSVEHATEWATDVDMDDSELSVKQYMYEKWLRIVEEGYPELRVFVERSLANIHGQWADRSLSDGAYAKALEELSVAANIHFRPGLAAKRMVVALAPELSRRLWGAHEPQNHSA